MDIDQRTVVRPPARPCAPPPPPSRSVLSRPVPRVALMDARLQRQGHSLTPHDVSPQPPLSSAATYRAEWGVQAAGVSKETKKGQSPSPTLLGNEVCILYQRHCVSLPSFYRSVSITFRNSVFSTRHCVRRIIKNKIYNLYAKLRLSSFLLYSHCVFI